METTRTEFSATLRAERAVSAAWASYAPVEGTRYNVEQGNKAVTIFAESEALLQRAARALLGPFRFETVIDSAGVATVMWHCPCCGTTLTTDPVSPIHLSMSDAFVEITSIAMRHAADRVGCKVAV